MTTPKQLSDYIPDGVCMGQAAADKCGFYGTTPIIQRSGGTQAKVATTAISLVDTTVSVSTGQWAWPSNQANAVVTQLNSVITQSAANMVLANELRASMVALGLIAGA